MNEYKRQYTERVRYENIPRYEIQNVDYLLPEWITNLKNYFKKKPDSDYSPAYS